MCKCNGNCCRNLPCPEESTPKGHPHAELMAQYAEDAKTTDKPWRLWEGSTGDGTSRGLRGHPSWNPNFYFRRKPRTININGYEVPEPVRVQSGSTVLTLWVCRPIQEVVSIVTYLNSNLFPEDNTEEAVLSLSEKGLLHATREAAELHAKALLSFTRKES
jgi:hypothetical protein